MAGKQTPVMQQHAAAKRAHPDAIVFFRLGDFYEMFGDDAVLVSRELNLTLTSRNKGKPDEVPMAGVPHHSAHAYIGRLLGRGYRIAICEQLADPKMVKGIVPRDVVRVLTPALTTHDDHLEARENNWLAALQIERTEVGIALLDISTNELRLARAGDVTTLLGELSHTSPRELLWESQSSEPEDLLDAKMVRAVLPSVALREDDALSEGELEEALGPLLADASAFSLAERRAGARALRFARRCHPGLELPIPTLGRWDPSASLVIDPNAQRHLELVESNSGDKRATLLATLDQACTPQGARLLRRRLLSPLHDVAQIRRRLDRVETCIVHAALREQVRSALQDVGDLERITSRVQLGEGSPKDLGRLRDGLVAAARVVEALTSLRDPGACEVLELAEPVDLVADLAERLSRALVERPSALAKEDSIFRPEFDEQLTALDETRKNGSELIVALETRLREETGIGALKARFTRVFGWYLEVSRSVVDRVPPEWRRKQTVANKERYTMDELDELADRIAGAEEQHRARELALLGELNEAVRTAAPRIFALSEKIAAWDVDCALAEVAHRRDYCRPEVTDTTELVIEDGRHPVVEQLAAFGQFVPNRVELDADAVRMWILTGPNMAGKSTFLRQVALIVILAQMGSFVPASSACIGLVDRVLSRVGASDNLAQGQSTFMVEMKETAEILRSVTQRSLVILDEIGRGTSTFDGLAIAWAVAEHLEQVSRCRSLVATHYHELTQLAEESEHIANHSVSARERDGDIVFLHRLIEGAASRSYGVAVAKLAGLPEVVLARARALLAALEGEQTATDSPEKSALQKSRRAKNPNQLTLFAKPEEPTSRDSEVLHTLRSVQVEKLTPLDALQLLVKLKQRL